ncbi:hypothetical protein DPMN_031106, partial [Dreissena polymorpha]
MGGTSFKLVFTIFILLVNSCVLGRDSDAVSDAQSADSRDGQSTAQIAIIVTGVVCGLAAIMCLGACGYFCYAKCCV